MEWQQIIGFYHVTKLRSFTRAAEATLRSQSALTQQIKALEREFDCQLLERIGKRKVIPTPLGERFFNFAESLLLDYNQLREDIAERRGLRRGQLRIAAPFTTLYHLLPGVIKKYHQQFPWVELSLLDRPQKDVVELVKSGDVDLGMTLESTVPRSLSKRRWKTIETVLLAPAGHPLSGEKRISLEKISQSPLILPPARSDAFQRNKLEALFRKNNLRYGVVMESSNIELSSLYVEMGLGISFASIVKELPTLKNLKKRKL
jgi:DNA-binding transcriptional LysR family regulator